MALTLTAGPDTVYRADLLYGVVADAAVWTGCAMTSASATLTNSYRTISDGAITNYRTTLTATVSPAFSAGDLGSEISIAGAGTFGTTLKTRIMSVTNGTTVELEAMADTTVTGAVVTVGRPFTAALVGKSVAVGEAATQTDSASEGAFFPLVTTVSAFVSATQLTLSATAQRTMSGRAAVIGTNNGTALRAAMDAAYAAGGGIVQLPRGGIANYDNTSIDISGAQTYVLSNCQLVGAGVGITTIYTCQGEQNGILVPMGSANWRIADISLDGAVNARGDGIKALCTRNGLVERVEVLRCYSGMGFKGGTDVTIRDVVVHSPAAGTTIESGTSVIACMTFDTFHHTGYSPTTELGPFRRFLLQNVEARWGFSRVPATNYNGQGIRIVQGGGYAGLANYPITLIGCKSTGSPGAGLWVQGIAVAVDGGSFADCAYAGPLQSGCCVFQTDYCTFVNTNFNNNAGCGLSFQGARYSSVVGCAANGNGSVGFHLADNTTVPIGNTFVGCVAQGNTLGGWSNVSTSAVPNMSAGLTETGNGAAPTYRSADLVDGMLKGSATWDPASLADAAAATTTVTVTGAAVGDTALASLSTATAAGWIIGAQVTAANTVTCTLFNKTGGALDLGSGTLRVAVRKQ